MSLKLGFILLALVLFILAAMPGNIPFDKGGWRLEWLGVASTLVALTLV